MNKVYMVEVKEQFTGYVLHSECFANEEDAIKRKSELDEDEEYQFEYITIVEHEVY